MLLLYALQQPYIALSSKRKRAAAVRAALSARVPAKEAEGAAQPIKASNNTLRLPKMQMEYLCFHFYWP